MQKQTLRIAFSGTRFKYFRNVTVGIWLVYDLVKQLLLNYMSNTEQVLVGHGGNPASVDAVVATVADELDLTTVCFAPKDWKSPRALLERNNMLAEWCDMLVAIYVDRESPGTTYTLNRAKQLGKQVQVYYVDTIERKVKQIKT